MSIERAIHVRADNIPRENGAKAALYFTISGFEYQRSGINSSAFS
jgi:hypothetical protein